MARPTVRVLALLELLQSSPRTRPLAELADHLGVDERTVRRYVDHLAELDVPVQSVRGRYGGIRLAPGYRMPPVMLTEDEAVAVVLGLLSARPVGSLADAHHPPDGLDDSAGGSALAKLRRVLPVALARRLQALTTNAEFATPAGPVAPPHAGVLLDLATAVQQHQPVAVDHTAGNGRRTQRTVHPYGLVTHRGRWYLAAADTSSAQLRTFRADRITATRLLPGGFDVPDGFVATSHVLSTLAATPWRHEVVLRIHGTPDRVGALFPAGLATTHDAPDHPGWTRAVLQAERLDWLPALLAGLPTAFVIESPRTLRDLVRALADRLTTAAAPDSDHTAGSDA